ncbi:MAG: hypothetical protein U5K79_06290 [Cyclobacteriaceae bacterium]|nr:hypothetical protein [Cyclobacteriaceae bacterium]
MTACLPEPDVKAPKIQSYYDIEGLIDGQIVLLDSVNPSFLKAAVVDGKEEHFQGKIANGEWKGELQILRGYDLNKPTLSDRYTTLETGDSSQKIVRYISKSPGTTLIDTLTLTFDNSRKKPLKIHAHTHSANSLFESGQTADVVFSVMDDDIIMKSYHIEGWQKLFGKAASHYSISSTLELP